jgi:hypothetical protein
LLAGKRELSVEDIRALSRRFGVSPATFINWFFELSPHWRIVQPRRIKVGFIDAKIPRNQRPALSFPRPKRNFLMRRSRDTEGWRVWLRQAFDWAHAEVSAEPSNQGSPASIFATIAWLEFNIFANNPRTNFCLQILASIG